MTKTYPNSGIKAKINLAKQASDLDEDLNKFRQQGKNNLGQNRPPKLTKNQPKHQGQHHYGARTRKKVSAIENIKTRTRSDKTLSLRH